MNNETALTIFNFQEKEVRIQLIEDKPWWVANDVCSILGYSNERDAIKRHCRIQGVVKRDTLTSKGIQSLTYINEGNIYRLIAKSKLPAADLFETWVFDEILPSVCKTGSYSVAPRDPISELERMAMSLVPIVGDINNRISVVVDRVSVVEDRQKQIDPEEIERRVTILHELKDLLVAGTEKTDMPVDWRKYWRAINKHIGISSIGNRAALTIEKTDRAITYARNWLFERGINPPVQGELL